MKLHMEYAVSEPGSAEKANEDRHGCNEHIAFVIDGATGLGERQYMASHASDAAWLAEFAKQSLLENTTPDSSMESVFSELMTAASRDFFAATNEPDIPRYAWPSASVSLVSLNENRMSFYGLGDCTAYVRTGSGNVRKLSALPDFAEMESALAHSHVERAQGIEVNQLLKDEVTTDQLRTIRAAQNTVDGGIWTLGLVPEAANRLIHHEFAVDADSTILICSDGFSALEETYGAYSPESLLDVAIKGGLDPLYQELRHIENNTDPTGEKFPRFKKSDDATAILIRTDK